MKVSFFPKSKLGIWSVILFIFLILAVAFFFIMVDVFGQRGGETFFSNLTLNIPMLTAWGMGVASFAVGVVDLIKSKTKSVLVFIVTVLTFLTTVFGICSVV